MTCTCLLCITKINLIFLAAVFQKVKIQIVCGHKVVISHTNPYTKAYLKVPGLAAKTEKGK
jgi:hypothetical protein